MGPTRAPFFYAGAANEHSNSFVHPQLAHHRETSISPQGVWIIQHHLDNQWNELTQELHTVAHLIAVDAAVPGRPTMHQLIAQHVDPT